MTPKLAVLTLLPAVLFAESTMPSIGYTGAPADHGGQTCVACHQGAPVNPAGGSLTVNVGDYKPNIQQVIEIVLSDPKAASWGFQITIREVSDETLSAGTFSNETSGPPVQVVCDDGSQYGSAPPCTPPARQFAEQNGAQRTSAGAGIKFDVPWMPPSQEVGKLDVYVAAVAGDGDGSASGDHVYTFSKTIANAAACSLRTRPTLTSVVNAASFQQVFSSNSLISIFGLNFGTHPRTAGLGDFENGGFPTELACVSVKVTGPGLPDPEPLPILYVEEGQINAQMPEFSGVGTVTLQVFLNPGDPNQLSSDLATFNTQLQQFAPAFFLFANSTSIAAQFGGTANIVAQPSVVPGAKPAKPGDWVTLYGTGFGDTDSPVALGQLATGISNVTNPITVTIGGITLSPSDVQYAGLSPGSIGGLYQFNVRIPESTASGDIPVTISIGSVKTQTGAAIPVQQ
jgi:uncharacterized protein (TIGR03437 family)